MKEMIKGVVSWTSAIALAMALVLTQGCGGLLGTMDNLPANVRAELESSLSRLDRSVETYDGIVAKQRVGFAQDTQGVIDGASMSLRTLAEQARASVNAVLATGQNLEENTIADLRGLVDSVNAKVEAQAAALQTGVDATIRTAARELDRQRAVSLLQMNTVVQKALGPTLAQLSVEGERLVGQVTSSVNTWIVRLLGGALVLCGGIALLVSLRRKLRALAIGSGVLATVGVPLTLAAAPLARIGAPKVELPSGEFLCAEMSKLGKQLERFETAKPKPNTRGTGETSKGPDEAGSLASDKERTANEVLQAANECLTYAPSPALAAHANQVATRAMALSQ